MVKNKPVSKQKLLGLAEKIRAQGQRNNYIVSIFFTPEFNKSITLMLVGHSVLGNIHIN